MNTPSTSHLFRLSLLIAALLCFSSSVCIAQSYPTNFKNIVPRPYCTTHQSNPVSIGTIAYPGNGNATGLQWQAVRPSGAVITSGTVISSPVTATVENGTLYRLRTNGNFFGFKFKGPWATAPVRDIINVSGSSHNCQEVTPLTIQSIAKDILTYEGTNRILSSVSALYIPVKSTIYVKTSTGTGVPGIPVYVYPSHLKHWFLKR